MGVTADLARPEPAVPWQQQPGESDEAYAAFRAWLLDPTRSPRDVPGGAEYSGLWEWQARANALSLHNRALAYTAGSTDPRDKLRAVLQLHLDTTLIETIKYHDLSRSSKQPVLKPAEIMKLIEFATDPERNQAGATEGEALDLSDCTPEEQLKFAKKLMAHKKKELK